MAGGMYGRRGPGIPLKDRGRAGAPAFASRVAPSAATPRRRHAWAMLAPGQDAVEVLVVEWFRDQAGEWAARVALVQDGQVITAQIPARQLRPASP